MGLMHFDVVTLFPEMVATVAEYGVVGRAQRNGLVALDCENPRDHTSDVHRTVDDRPYGGGPGMVMKYEPLAGALAAARSRVPEGSLAKAASVGAKTVKGPLPLRVSTSPAAFTAATIMNA